nr:hypothetical protein [Saprospiraceae bacterium]
GYKTNGLLTSADAANGIIGPNGNLMQEGDIRFVGSEDGIVGEAIDICLCALDIVWQKTDGKMTREEVIAFINKKLLKWQSTTDKKTKQNASKTNSGNT